MFFCTGTHPALLKRIAQLDSNRETRLHDIERELKKQLRKVAQQEQMELDHCVVELNVTITCVIAYLFIHTGG